jgi:3-dehydrotetronate 4-kinase
MMLGCIADDYTGATDLSSMLVRAGLRVIQSFGTETSADLSNVDAVVVSLKSRSIAASDAVAQSLQALRFLQSIGATHFFFKYCSTFDSTPAGNIGPVAEALADALNVDQLWFCPAFPENGRTVYCGHLFVHGIPLHESGMKDHPLNPMRDSNLVRVLAAQTKSPVGLLALEDLHAARTPQASTTRHWIVDAIADADLAQIATLADKHTLLTGGSAIARFWAACCVAPSSTSNQSIPNTPAPSQTIILAGSCSLATQRQIQTFTAASYPQHQLDIIQANSSFEESVQSAVTWCLDQSPSPALLSSYASVAATVSALGEVRAAELTEAIFGAIARQLAAQGVHRIIVAGGETSGAVMNALGIDAIRIGQEIAPGVPCVHTLRPPYMSLALKSGNFGSDNFFLDAIKKLA